MSGPTIAQMLTGAEWLDQYDSGKDGNDLAPVARWLQDQAERRMIAAIAKKCNKPAAAIRGKVHEQAKGISACTSFDLARSLYNSMCGGNV